MYLNILRDRWFLVEWKVLVMWVLFELGLNVCYQLVFYVGWECVCFEKCFIVGSELFLYDFECEVGLLVFWCLDCEILVEIQILWVMVVGNV